MALFPELEKCGFSRCDFDGVIFDFDGTLASSMHVWTNVDRAFAEKYSMGALEEWRDSIIGLGFEDTAEYFIKHLGVTLTMEECIAEFNRLAEYEYQTNVFLKPGVKEFFDLLDSRGVPFCIASSLNRRLLDFALELNGVSDRFVSISLCDDHKTHKSEPDIYLIAAQTLGIAPERCMVFEDIVPALKSAQKAGMYAVGVLDEENEAQDTSAVRLLADATITSYYEMLD